MTLRSDIDNKFKWHLEDLFENDDLWQKDFDEVKKKVNAIEKNFKGKLNDLDVLKKCLDESRDIGEKLGRLYVYAFMRFHEDMNNNFYNGMTQKVTELESQVSAKTCFIEPEILNISEDGLNKFVAKNNLYEFYIKNMLRMKKHILSPEEEKILADAKNIAVGPADIFGMLNNADINFGKIKLPDEDKEVELTHGNFISFMESNNREFRKNVFEKYYAEYLRQKNTIQAIYSASVKKDVFFAKTRKFKSCLESKLYGNNIPESVYFNLIDTVHKYLPVLHDYMALRKKILGVSELYMYDIYVPLVHEMDKKIEFDEAKEIVKKALLPLGEDYVEKLNEGLNGGWIDVYENKGKRCGAYQWGSYGCHPFVLLNYDNKLDDVFTLAHEMGHAMHSCYSWGKQENLYADYTIFLAEIASTVNETLLIKYLLKNNSDSKFRAYLLNYFIEQFRRTLYRQTMFAEFELKAHEFVENGQPLTLELLNKTYHDLNLMYHGKDVVFDENSDIEWMRIPHFYKPFYVYQYATGHSAAIALAEKILSGENKYREFLESGSSKYSIEILKNAGVDMTTPEPIENALKYFKELVNEFKNLV